MQIFMQQLINGLSLGSIYALLALGYTMIYGIIKIIHFAHGDVYMLGAFFGYYTINVWHFNFIMALFGSMIFCALVGMLIEFVAYRPLRHSSRIAVLITAIGVSYFLENGMSVLFSGDTRDFPQVIKQVNYEWFGIRVTNIQLLIFATTIILMIILQLIVKKTKMGRAMRAAAADPVAAELMGININGTISFVFAIGSAMAGAAGVLIGLYYNSIEPTMGLTPGIKAFVAAVVGGVGSIPGAAVGAVIIGCLESLMQAIGFSAFKDAAVYVVLIIVLLFLPAGLFGNKQPEKV
ncbi:branched-chain amino acid ABC transporter permease [Limosilactobacillus mucosae]|uniref:Branched-chain amino acid ABC transporter permease n=1 Tax=Limosilactobacillus mucosae TaxID=97478 RepID=A0AAJ1M9M2_LIMMU|nr:branched-chain amino acid ABC transporter permease [Limosilactobacillus mucosae]MDD6454729.1 branched-chain amino acid ABC transporter permease [Lactobacillus sp.]NME33924.1 branched-chain amino acid ABC transporter permease [Lactobacillus sp. MRS-253-APC-2B]MBN2900513.1 branched-chain amino acid ABC transporter permease [Limosilactobacillus mucosae]MDC2827013.1 branched-chain amino acid ABC transporter permease [Limosilactobacillus mucosae]MDC2828760.1 branched-chain amino acid ABC transpo